VNRLIDSPWLRGPLVYLVVLGVQMSLLADVRVGGAAADIMLGFAIAGGLVAGAERGVLAAFAVGILYDLLLTTPFGLSALAYTLAAFIVAQLTSHLLRHVWWFTMLVGTVASAAGVVLYATLGALFGLTKVFTWHLVTIVDVVAIVNGLLMPVVLRVQRWTLAAGTV